jgi:hypothetical protein
MPSLFMPACANPLCALGGVASVFSSTLDGAVRRLGDAVSPSAAALSSNCVILSCNKQGRYKRAIQRLISPESESRGRRRDGLPCTWTSQPCGDILYVHRFGMLGIEWRAIKGNNGTPVTFNQVHAASRGIGLGNAHRQCLQA